VCRRRLEYPALKRAVREQQSLFGANVVLIEDKASGTQLIQELIADSCHAVTRYQPTMDKTMRLRLSNQRCRQKSNRPQRHSRYLLSIRLNWNRTLRTPLSRTGG
jgi:phage terminase large subunit-like protein